MPLVWIFVFLLAKSYCMPPPLYMMPYFHTHPIHIVEVRCANNGLVEPQIIPIAIGSHRVTENETYTIYKKGSVSLIRSKGRNILFDVGNVGQFMDIKRGLMNSHCGKIDSIVYSHGHSSHYENRLLIKNAAMTVVGDFIAQGSISSASSLHKGERFFLYNDPNLEVIQTPGHTSKSDISLVVRNVPEKGTVVLSGDTFLYQNDENDFAEFAEDVEKQKESRKKIVCLADFILPGHGPIFQVTPDMKIAAACESGKSMNVRSIWTRQ